MEHMRLHGRHVLAHGHAVKSCRSQWWRGFTPHYVILDLSSQGSGASEPLFLCVCLYIPMHSEENPHKKIVCYPFSHPPWIFLSSGINLFITSLISKNRKPWSRPMLFYFCVLVWSIVIFGCPYPNSCCCCHPWVNQISIVVVVTRELTKFLLLLLLSSPCRNWSGSWWKSRVVRPMVEELSWQACE
jgi:hypothetical protein